MMITQAVMREARSPRSDAREVAEALQGVLVDLVDLSLLGKHAHWNLQGVTFRSLHLQLDELVDVWRSLSDEVAERAATLGFAPDAQAATVARYSRIDVLPTGRINDRDLVEELTERLGGVIDRARVAMGEAAARDSISEGLLIEVVKTLEKQHWMLRAQREPA